MIKLSVIIFGFLITSIGFAGNEGGGMAYSANMMTMVADGRLALPANLESIIADSEMPVTELPNSELNRIKRDLLSREFSSLPNNPSARALLLGDTVISQDIDRVVSEVRGYSE